MPREPLILHYRDLTERTARLFDVLAKSEAERAAFIANPAGTLGHRVMGGRRLIEPREVDRTNRIIFALLSNPRFLEWTEDYELKIYDEVMASRPSDRAEARRRAMLALNRRRVMRDFAEGMAEWGDAELLYALGLPTFATAQDDLEVGFGGPTVILIQGVVVFTQVAVLIDQALAIHQTVGTEPEATTTGHADVFLVNDHVLFTTHDFFVDNDARADAQANADADAEAEADANAFITSDARADSSADTIAAADAQSDAASTAQADAGAGAQADAGAGAQADAGTGAQADAGAGAQSDAASDAGSDAQADAGSDAGSDAQTGANADASGFGDIFGLSRSDLQQFAGYVAIQTQRYAEAVRRSGRLLEPGPISIDSTLGEIE